MISTICIAGIVLTVVLLLVVSIASGKGVKDGKSFSTGNGSGSWMVCGALIGTMVGGQSTIGTAQLAFSYGLSAWWFTIGAAIGSLVLALGYARSIRHSQCTTILEIVGKAYGKRSETIGSVLSLVGIFISIVAQILAASALMGSLFPIAELPCLLVSAVLIMLFVLFGGIKSAGAGGLVKMALLYLSSLVAGFVVLHIGGGFRGLEESVLHLLCQSPLHDISRSTTVQDIAHRYESMFARGGLNDLGACLSLVLGVVCTQTYAQAIWSATSTKKARQGALLCAILIPVIGFACTMVGLYMRGHYVTQQELEMLLSMGVTLPEGTGVLQSSAEAFPVFVLQHLPDWMGGIVLGTLLVTILGGGSGLALGCSTILVRDVYRNMGLKGEGVNAYRLTIVGILMLGVLFASSFKGAFINDLGFLSLGLRATSILFPLTLAIVCPRRYKGWVMETAMISGTVGMIAAEVAEAPGAPLFWGLGIEMLIILLCSRKKNRK